MYSALDISKWFLYKNFEKQKENIAENDEFDIYEVITHLKLQKLLYNAQGVYLALTDEKLFDEKLIAWEHGPVVKEVYDKYKLNGRKVINFETNDINIIQTIEKDKKTNEILEMVYDTFSIYTAWQLREMSHEKGTPWDMTESDKEISIILLKEYFKKEVVVE